MSRQWVGGWQRWSWNMIKNFLMRDEMSVAIVPLLFMSAAELFVSDASRRSLCQLSRPPDITYKSRSRREVSVSREERVSSECKIFPLKVSCSAEISILEPKTNWTFASPRGSALSSKSEKCFWHVALEWRRGKVGGIIRFSSSRVCGDLRLGLRSDWISFKLCKLEAFFNKFPEV